MIKKTKDNFIYFIDFYKCNCINCVFDLNKEADPTCSKLFNLLNIKYHKGLICDIKQKKGD